MNWTTLFLLNNDNDLKCECQLGFFRHFENGKTNSPDDLVTIFVDVHRWGWIEYHCVDVERGGSEWTYYIPYHFPSFTGA